MSQKRITKNRNTLTCAAIFAFSALFTILIVIVISLLLVFFWHWPQNFSIESSSENCPEKTYLNYLPKTKFIQIIYIVLVGVCTVCCICLSVMLIKCLYKYNKLSNYDRGKLHSIQILFVTIGIITSFCALLHIVITREQISSLKSQIQGNNDLKTVIFKNCFQEQSFNNLADKLSLLLTIMILLALVCILLILSLIIIMCVMPNSRQKNIPLQNKQIVKKVRQESVEVQVLPQTQQVSIYAEINSQQQLKNCIQTATGDNLVLGNYTVNVGIDVKPPKGINRGIGDQKAQVLYNQCGIGQNLIIQEKQPQKNHQKFVIHRTQLSQFHKSQASVLKTPRQIQIKQEPLQKVKEAPKRPQHKRPYVLDIDGYYIYSSEQSQDQVRASIPKIQQIEIIQIPDKALPHDVIINRQFTQNDEEQDNHKVSSHRSKDKSRISQLMKSKHYKKSKIFDPIGFGAYADQKDQRALN